jgi:hypothetical protein
MDSVAIGCALVIPDFRDHILNLFIPMSEKDGETGMAMAASNFEELI